MIKSIKKFISAVIVTAMAATMVVLPMTAQADVPVPEPAYIWRFVTVRENELRTPSAAGNDDLRSAEHHPPPHR